MAVHVHFILVSYGKCWSANLMCLFSALQCPLSIGYNDKYLEESVRTKFLGFKIDNYLNWKSHSDQLVPKLSRVCFMYDKIMLSYFVDVSVV
jgi:hypothetical protein